MSLGGRFVFYFGFSVCFFSVGCRSSRRDGKPLALGSKTLTGAPLHGAAPETGVAWARPFSTSRVVIRRGL